MLPVSEGLVVFLVDGYNLMHAVGMAPPRQRPGRFESARTRFLDWIADSPGGRNRLATVRIIFDAQHGYGLSKDLDYRGLRLRYATGDTADDLIERLLQSEALPDRITVVSNDQRVREAGRRRGSICWSCDEFVDWLLAGGVVETLPLPPPDEKPSGPVTPTEAAELLAIFETPKPR